MRLFFHLFLFSLFCCGGGFFVVVVVLGVCMSVCLSACLSVFVNLSDGIAGLSEQKDFENAC